MARYNVQFSPIHKAVTVEAGTTLLEAAGKAHITIDSVCGGDGICGRCKMIVREGKVGGNVSSLLTREEIRQGVVLACQTAVESDLVVDIPEETRAQDKIVKFSIHKRVTIIDVNGLQCKFFVQSLDFWNIGFALIIYSSDPHTY